MRFYKIILQLFIKLRNYKLLRQGSFPRVNGWPVFIGNINFWKIKEKNNKYINKYIYFIGQPVSAMRRFTAEDYIRCVREIVNKCSYEKPLYYIPHRVEDLNLIENIKNIEVVEPNVPIEMHFLENNGLIPKEIYSCYSTALITLPSLFENIKATAIKNKYMTQDDIGFMYSYFSNNDIDIIEL